MAAGLIVDAGFGAAGPGDGVVAGEVVEEPEGHLGAAGVVGAQEQHHRHPDVVLAFDLGQRAQPLAGEPLGQQRQVVRDDRAAGELVVGAVQEPLDGLDAEGAVELAGQASPGLLDMIAAMATGLAAPSLSPARTSPPCCPV